MSASLVGSEMCIRDRSLVQTLFDLMRLHMRARILASSSDGCPPCMPVSYTHLTLPTICSV
eukprot:7860602-Alexandrium_andersonii.AAC.1